MYVYVWQIVQTWFRAWARMHRGSCRRGLERGHVCTEVAADMALCCFCPSNLWVSSCYITVSVCSGGSAWCGTQEILGSILLVLFVSSPGPTSEALEHPIGLLLPIITLPELQERQKKQWPEQSRFFTWSRHKAAHHFEQRGVSIAAQITVRRRCWCCKRIKV